MNLIDVLICEKIFFIRFLGNNINLLNAISSRQSYIPPGHIKRLEENFISNDLRANSNYPSRYVIMNLINKVTRR